MAAVKAPPVVRFEAARDDRARATRPCAHLPVPPSRQPEPDAHREPPRDADLPWQSIHADPVHRPLAHDALPSVCS